MGNFKILLAPGDGIGPEIAVQARKVLDRISARFGHRFDYDEELVGGVAIAAYGVALRPECLEKARASDAILFGAVGDPRYDDPSARVRPEQALLGLRGNLGLFANLRPVKIYEPLIDESPIKADRIRGTDILVVRELTGGIYFGKPQRRFETEEGRQAVDTMAYGEAEIERILHVAFNAARKRKRHLTVVDKANVLETSRLWREVAKEVAGGYPDVAVEFVLVDACAMHLINRPNRFDVIVTENMFGDILTDEAAMISGSLGMMPSASLGAIRPDGTGFGMFEPIHGSAPDIAGRALANPIGMIMSAAMMLRMSFNLEEEAAVIEAAVEAVLVEGYRTADIGKNAAKRVDTIQMGRLIADKI